MLLNLKQDFHRLLNGCGVCLEGDILLFGVLVKMVTCKQDVT